MPSYDANDEQKPRPSRDTLVRIYDAENATRARNARLRTQDAMRERANRQPRHPLTTQESYDRTQTSREAYERARARRDVRQTQSGSRDGNREVIDGRGSIDSRAFNENNELVGYTINRDDRHNPALDSIESGNKWSSRAGQGFVDNPYATKRGSRPRDVDFNNLSDTISGRADYQTGRSRKAIPLSIKLLAVLIVILLVVLIVLLVM